MSYFRRSRFNPARGGHAPGDLRDAFLSAVDGFWNGDLGPTSTIEFRGHELTVEDLCGLLWNCTDAIPSAYRAALEDLLQEPLPQVFYDRPIMTENLWS